jgi:hypothetical protein
MHKFNDVEIRTPTSFSWDMEDIEVGESQVTADGLDHSEILTQKRNIAYEWTDPTKEEVSTILQLINQNRYVNITYPDAMSGIYETREFKVIKKGAPFRNLRVGALLYSALSLDFKER